jgi:hypothetical protein
MTASRTVVWGGVVETAEAGETDMDFLSAFITFLV